jgi:hypothetical protein
MAFDEATPRFTARPHPRGSDGAHASLEECVQRVHRSYLHPKLRAWSIEELEKAGWPKDNLTRCRVLFAAIKREWKWIADPWDTELMVHPVCMIDGSDPTCGTDGIRFLAGDCDDLLIFTLACFLSIGIGPCYVVGHCYDTTNVIGHVLGLVDSGDAIWYADPSADFGFGKSLEPRRERILAVPTAAVVADSRGRCDLARVKKIGATLAARATGDFVGVGRAPGLSGPETPACEPPSMFGWRTWLSAGIGAAIGATAMHLSMSREKRSASNPSEEWEIEYARKRAIEEAAEKAERDRYAPTPAQKRKLLAEAISDWKKLARQKKTPKYTKADPSEYEPVTVYGADDSLLDMKGKPYFMVRKQLVRGVPEWKRISISWDPLPKALVVPITGVLRSARLTPKYPDDPDLRPRAPKAGKYFDLASDDYKDAPLVVYERAILPLLDLL